MNIINPKSYTYLAILLFVAFSNAIFAFDDFPFYPPEFSSDTTFSCNELIHVSVNENCEGDIDADEIVEGYEGDFDDFDLVAKYFYDTIPIPIPSDFVGETVKLIATHMPSGLSCWGEASIEDKWAPQITCSDYTFFCFENPNAFPLPTVWDNCGIPNIFFTGEYIENSNVCEGVTIVRTYYAEDDWGNTSSP